MADPTGPGRRDDAPRRRRRSSMTPRQRRKAQRAAARRRQHRDRAPEPTPPPRERVAASPTPDTSSRASRRRPHPSRTQVQRGQRRRRRTVVIVVAAIVALVGIGVGAVVSGLYDRAVELVTGSDEPDEATTVPVDQRQPSAVVVTYDEDFPSEAASRVMVLASDLQTQESTALLVPTATIVDVPGRGSFELGEAHALGGSDLVAASLENLLGARFDQTVELTVQGWAELLERAGGFTVDVRRQLVQREQDGGQVRFEPGTQHLDGPRLAEYLTFEAEDESELEGLLRVQQVVNGLLDRIAEDPELLDRLFAEGAPMIGADDTDDVRTLLEQLAAARQGEELTVLTLPVAPLGGGEDVYRADEERVEALVEEHFAASRPTGSVGAGTELQILNGNGEPGIGEDVTRELRDGGYRIVLTGNADDFDHQTTQIVVYEETAEQVAIAQDIQERLGVGEIVRSEVPQSVVDVTIVVGHDYLDE